MRGKETAVIFLTNDHVQQVLDMRTCLEAMEDASRKLGVFAIRMKSDTWAGRTNDRQITFLNNQGTQGLQFAAVGGTTYNLAKAKGLGHPLPIEWFTQNIRD